MSEIVAAPWQHGTNIMTVSVPEQMNHRVSTGIDWFDYLFDGGPVPGQAIIIDGPPGLGKTTVMLEACDHMLGSGLVAPLFNTTEESLYKVRKTVSRLGLEHGFYAGIDQHVESIIAHLEKIKALNPEKQIVLVTDSIQKTFMAKDAQPGRAAAHRAAMIIREWCEKNFAIALLIGQQTKLGDAEGLNKIIHDLDAHLHAEIDTKRTSKTFGKRLWHMKKNREGTAGIGYLTEMTGCGIKPLCSFEDMPEYLKSLGASDEDEGNE